MRADSEMRPTKRRSVVYCNAVVAGVPVRRAAAELGFTEMAGCGRARYGHRSRKGGGLEVRPQRRKWPVFEPAAGAAPLTRGSCKNPS